MYTMLTQRFCFVGYEVNPGFLYYVRSQTPGLEADFGTEKAVHLLLPASLVCV